MKVTGLLIALLCTLPAVADPPQRSRRTPVVEVFEQCRDSVVNVSTSRVVRVQSQDTFDEVFGRRPRVRTQRVESVGSGAVIHELGYIVTNAHVVAQTSDVQVTLADGRTVPAIVVAVDNEHDLAVLRASVDAPLKAIRLGRSDDLLVGETVIAVGNPFGLQHTVTSGIISALNRELDFGERAQYTGLIQTDAAINRGNSGGPLLNVNGELIGINTAVRGDAQNVGFAIPVDRLWDLLPKMLDIERRARVRFGLRVTGPEAEVASIAANSPAARAGLRPGDRLVGLAGRPVRNAIDYYVELLQQAPASDVPLEVRRGERSLRVQVPLQEVPIPDGRKLAAERLGLELAELSPQVRTRLQLPENMGLLVERVRPRTPADGLIRTGDVILRLDRIPVARLEGVGLALEGVRAGERVQVEGLRLDADPAFLWSATLRAGR